MTVHIDMLESQVIGESEPNDASGSATGQGDERWAEIQRLRSHRERLRRDALRTRADEFDD